MMFVCSKGHLDRFKLGKGDKVSSFRCKKCRAKLKTISAEEYRNLKDEEVYLDYVNNFLTVAAFAEHYGLTEPVATSFINRVRESRELRLKKENNEK